MTIRFGTDGWRAIVAQDYTYENVGKVLQAFCDLCSDSPNKKVILGYDRRFSGALFAREATEVLLGNGFEVLLSDQFCPTPCISWMTKHHRALAGVVITASHNPFQWNGVKFKESYGGSAAPEWTTKIEKLIEQNDAASRHPCKMNFEETEAKNFLTYFSPHHDYLRQLRRLVDIRAIQKAKLRVLADPIYGAGSGFFKKVLGKQVEEIRSENNPSFGGVNPEPIEKNLKLAAETVRKQRFHVALATDGDADRIGALDEKGHFVDSHTIFSLLLRHLVTVKGWKGDVVKTVSTTQRINRLGEQYGLKVIETPIGFKFICQEFLKCHPLIGGEESGGIGIAKHVYERDGILCGLLLLEIMAYHRKPLSKIIAELQKQTGPLYFLRGDIHLPLMQIQRTREALGKGVTPNFSGFKLKEKNFADGYKFIFSDQSWLLIRPSGTEPLLRIYAEASSLIKTKKLLQIGKSFVEKI